MVTTNEKSDPRVKRTRELIQRAFLELLQERGFEAIRVQDIAERATINRATFYAHFEDKYALFDALLHEMFLHEVSERLPAGAPLTAANLRALAGAVFSLVDQVEGHCKPTDRQTLPSVEAATQRGLAVYLKAWLRRSAPPGATHAPELAVAATVMSWAMFGAALDWARGDHQPARELAVNRLVTALVDGIAHTTRITIH